MPVKINAGKNDRIILGPGVFGGNVNIAVEGNVFDGNVNRMWLAGSKPVARHNLVINSSGNAIYLENAASGLVSDNRIC